MSQAGDYLKFLTEDESLRNEPVHKSSKCGSAKEQRSKNEDLLRSCERNTDISASAEGGNNSQQFKFHF